MLANKSLHSFSLVSFTLALVTKLARADSELARLWQASWASPGQLGSARFVCVPTTILEASRTRPTRAGSVFCASVNKVLHVLYLQNIVQSIVNIKKILKKFQEM